MPKMIKLYHFFGGFYPPLQIFDSYGVLKPTKTLSNLINAKIFKRVFSGGH
jgi:hypothetical protein